jgi:hypothetical protein
MSPSESLQVLIDDDLCELFAAVGEQLNVFAGHGREIGRIPGRTEIMGVGCRAGLDRPCRMLPIHPSRRICVAAGKGALNFAMDRGGRPRNAADLP